jgi:hypothetical protein
MLQGAAHCTYWSKILADSTEMGVESGTKSPLYLELFHKKPVHVKHYTYVHQLVWVGTENPEREELTCIEQ